MGVWHWIQYFIQGVLPRLQLVLVPLATFTASVVLLPSVACVARRFWRLKLQVPSGLEVLPHDPEVATLLTFPLVGRTLCKLLKCLGKPPVPGKHTSLGPGVGAMCSAWAELVPWTAFVFLDLSVWHLDLCRIVMAGLENTFCRTNKTNQEF